MDSQNDTPVRAPEETLSRIGGVLLVLSGKGGVGKSTVAVNLADALARSGRRVGLLDIDMHGPSVPGMLGLDDARILTDGTLLQPVPVQPNLAVMSIGFMLRDRGDSIIWRGPLKSAMIRRFLTEVDWGELDTLIVDAPPGTGDEPLGIAQLIAGKGRAVIVTTPQKVAVDDVRKSISFCRALGIPVLGVIENMSGFVCPNCGSEHALFSIGGGQALAVETGIPFLGAIPIDMAVQRSGDRGVPFATDGDSPARRAFDTIIRKLQEGGYS